MRFAIERSVRQGVNQSGERRFFDDRVTVVNIAAEKPSPLGTE
jgi:hypothetical protein